MEIIVNVKMSDKERVKEAAKRIIAKVASTGFDVEAGGLLYDIMLGCGVTSEEITAIANSAENK